MVGTYFMLSKRLTLVQTTQGILWGEKQALRPKCEPAELSKKCALHMHVSPQTILM